MTKDDFNEIWTKVVAVPGKAVYDSIEAYKKDYSINTLLWDEHYKKSVHEAYEQNKIQLKQQYYKGETQRIDQHKIAACLCKALIDNMMFSFELKNNIPEQIAFINYQIAYLASTGIVYLYLMDYYWRIENNDALKKLSDMHQLAIPATTVGHDSYNMGRLKTLGLNHIYGNDFDLLTYSDMMFWLEQYTRQVVENKVIINPIDWEKVPRRK